MVDFEYAQPSEDYSEARAMTIHNLKFIGWAISSRMASTLVSPTVPCGSSAERSHPKGSAHSSRSGDGKVLSSDKLCSL